ncbi:MAG: zinc-binding dehydrogenase [Candidatus Heimdallarchaeaceae archaeon]
MKAAILEKQNFPLVVENVEIPELDYGQVLVRIHYSGICGAQLNEIFGNKGEDKYLPHLMGHEGGGIVVDVGVGVSKVKKGDNVVVHWRKGSGIESNPPKYRRKDGSFVGGGWNTTFSDHSVVSENRVTKIDKDVPLEIAALMGCAVTTGFGIINNEAKLKIGQSIVVVGCGGVGLNVIQGASLVSGNPIIAIDHNSYKLTVADWVGATDTINSDFVDFRDEVFKIVGNKGVDVVVDCTGNTEVIDKALQITASNGKLILVGQTKAGESISFSNMSQHYKGKTIFDSQGGLTDPDVDISRYLGLYKRGKLQLDQMITHVFPLEKVNEAIESVRSGDACKCVLEMIENE